MGISGLPLAHIPHPLRQVRGFIPCPVDGHRRGGRNGRWRRAGGLGVSTPKGVVGESVVQRVEGKPGYGQF